MAMNFDDTAVVDFGRPGWPPPADAEWHKQVVRDVTEAQRLLARLKAEGHDRCRLSVAGELVVVRWV